MLLPPFDMNNISSIIKYKYRKCILRSAKVFISQDGVDWKRDKWPWYGKLYLKILRLLTAHLPNEVIFDNVIAKKDL